MPHRVLYIDTNIKRGCFNTKKGHIFEIKSKHQNNVIKFYYKYRGSKWLKFATKYENYCQYCKEMQPNQQAHMQSGGCMSDNPIKRKYIWKKKQYDLLVNKYCFTKSDFISIFNT